MQKVAILGATGYIGRSLVHRFSKDTKYEVSLFVQSVDKAQDFLRKIKCEDKFTVFGMDSFLKQKYDVIINCTGIGNPAVLKEDPKRIFEVTESVDDLIIKSLVDNPDSLYINISSGAVYKVPDVVTEEKDFYGLAKKQSEEKHRALDHLNIVDLRVFSFFSRFYDKDAGFLMSEIADCIVNKKTFVTGSGDIFRDFVITEDLYNLIVILMEKVKINDYYDVYSSSPVGKIELLEVLKGKYALDVEIKEGDRSISPTGVKNEYFSKDHKAESLGYKPAFSSIEGVIFEIDKLF